MMLTSRVERERERERQNKVQQGRNHHMTEEIRASFVPAFQSGGSVMAIRGPTSLQPAHEGH